jgi:hypothetical protein
MYYAYYWCNLNDTKPRSIFRLPSVQELLQVCVDSGRSTLRGDPLGFETR